MRSDGILVVLSVQLNPICVCLLPIMSSLAGRTEIREGLKLQWSLRKPLKLPLSFRQAQCCWIFPCPEKVHAGKRFCWVDSQRSADVMSQLWRLFCWRAIFISVLEDKSLWQRNFRRALISWSSRFPDLSRQDQLQGKMWSVHHADLLTDQVFVFVAPHCL